MLFSAAASALLLVQFITRLDTEGRRLRFGDGMRSLAWSIAHVGPTCLAAARKRSGAVTSVTDR